MSESDMEVPATDFVEQMQSVVGDDEKTIDDEPGELPADVNEADAVEQQRTVELDDDDYR